MTPSCVPGMSVRGRVRVRTSARTRVRVRIRVRVRVRVRVRERSVYRQRKKAIERRLSTVRVC